MVKQHLVVYHQTNHEIARKGLSEANSQERQLHHADHCFSYTKLCGNLCYFLSYQDLDRNSGNMRSCQKLNKRRERCSVSFNSINKQPSGGSIFLFHLVEEPNDTRWSNDINIGVNAWQGQNILCGDGVCTQIIQWIQK